MVKADGRVTMAIAFILMFAPVLYMHFVAGFTAPADARDVI
nr:hypothetical protein [Enterocloster clostridioformis]